MAAETSQSTTFYKAVKGRIALPIKTLAIICRLALNQDDHQTTSLAIHRLSIKGDQFMA